MANLIKKKVSTIHFTKNLEEKIDSVESEISNMLNPCRVKQESVKFVVPEGVQSYKYVKRQDTPSDTELEIVAYNNSNVLKDISYMFEGIKVHKLNLSVFNFSTVRDVNGMFANSIIDILDTRNIDTSNVFFFSEAFKNAEIKELDLSDFNTSDSYYMYRMFYGFKTERLDLTSFDTTLVNNMMEMFKYCKIGVVDISSFVIEGNCNTKDIFLDAEIDTLIISESLRNRLDIPKTVKNIEIKTKNT